MLDKLRCRVIPGTSGGVGKKDALRVLLLLLLLLRRVLLFRVVLLSLLLLLLWL